MKKTNKCVHIPPDSAFQWVISFALLYTGMMIWKRHAVALIVALKSWREELTTFLNKTTIQDGIHSTWAWEVNENKCFVIHVLLVWVSLLLSPQPSKQMKTGRKYMSTYVQLVSIYHALSSYMYWLNEWNVHEVVLISLYYLNK